MFAVRIIVCACVLYGFVELSLLALQLFLPSSAFQPGLRGIFQGVSRSGHYYIFLFLEGGLAYTLGVLFAGRRLSLVWSILSRRCGLRLAGCGSDEIGEEEGGGRGWLSLFTHLSV